ncbi:hypothetical protein C8R45DRAFT_832825, partial [Mycena sanguinolenta]
SEEERMKLAVETTNKGLLSERGAAKYYRVPRATLQSRRQGVLTRVEAHVHERVVSPVQEDVLVGWAEVRVYR